MVKLAISLKKLELLILGISLVLSSLSCDRSAGSSAPKIQTDSPTTTVQFQSQNPDVKTQEIKKQIESDLRDTTFDVTLESIEQLREQIGGGADRRSVREAEDLKRTQELYRLNQEEIKKIQLMIQKKYRDNLPTLEKLNTKKPAIHTVIRTRLNKKSIFFILYRF